MNAAVKTGNVSANEVAVMLSGYTVWAAVNLFRGFDVCSLPLLALFTLVGMCTGTGLFPVFLGSALIGLISPELMPWALLVAGMVACSACDTMKLSIRITGFLAVASTLWLIPVSFSIPLVVVAAAAVLTARSRFRYLLIPAGFLFSVFVTGLPESQIFEPVIAGSEISDGILTYIIPDVNTATPEVLLPAPYEGTWALWIAIEAGGVRDTMPMTAIRLGENMMLLPSGRDTLSFTMDPGDTLAITLMRDHKPFYHSVIHATAGGERL